KCGAASACRPKRQLQYFQFYRDLSEINSQGAGLRAPLTLSPGWLLWIMTSKTPLWVTACLYYSYNLRRLQWSLRKSRRQVFSIPKHQKLRRLTAFRLPAWAQDWCCLCVPSRQAAR
ncbi:hypothetical protein MC885_005238, partial [Smutsia gigantea]